MRGDKWYQQAMQGSPVFIPRAVCSNFEVHQADLATTVLLVVRPGDLLGACNFIIFFLFLLKEDMQNSQCIFYCEGCIREVPHEQAVLEVLEVDEVGLFLRKYIEKVNDKMSGNLL